MNLDAYQYGGLNPVKYIDPNGMWIDKSETKQFKIGKKYFKGTVNYGKVTKGDSLWGLASKQLGNEGREINNSTIHNKIKDIKNINNLKNDKIYEGQTLFLGISNPKVRKIGMPLRGGYSDWNFSAGLRGVGLTGGVMLDDYGNFYLYAGGGIMTPGIGSSLTFSPNSVDTGWNVGLQGVAGIGSQIGYSKNGWFGEIGGGSVGCSVTGYYIWDLGNFFNSFGKD